MNWILFLVSTLLLIPFLPAQSLNDLEAPTEDHQQIPGTQVYLIPPEDFDSSPNFKGFQNPEDPTSMIMAVEIPGPYAEVSAGFNEEQLLSRGMDLKIKKAIQINGYQGLWINLDQEANGMTFSKHVLIYGDSAATTLINGVFIADSVQLGEAIQVSMESIFLDRELEVNPRETLDYTLDESGTKLRFLNVMGNAMLFNRDGLTPTESEDKATLIVDKSFAEVDISDPESFCISRLSQYPDNFEFMRENGLEEVEIDGLQGYGLYAINEELEEEAYQLILFREEGGYFLFFGSYKPEAEQAKADIMKLIKSFKRKG